MQLETATEGEYKRRFKKSKTSFRMEIRKKIFHMAVII